jgi:hypothetical protein
MKIALPNLDAEETGVSNHELRRFLAGELSPERRAQLESDASLAPRLAKLAAEQRAEDAAFALEVPMPRFLADHATRTQPKQGLVARWLSTRFTFGATALVAAAAAIFLVVRTPDAGDDGVRLKGEARVGFLVREAEGARMGREGEQLRAGDQIQFAVKDTAEHKAMVLVGVDGRGAVTVYAAERIDGERPKGPTGEQMKPRVLTDSVVLDDSTGAERFFVVYADTDVEQLRREVEEAARKLQPNDIATTPALELPRGYTQSSVHIVKVGSE